MTEREIIRHIDHGANLYISLFGAAEHMDILDAGAYRFVHPKAGEQGISFVYDIRIEDLPAPEQQRIIDEIKALGVPCWVSLTASDGVFRRFFSTDRPHGQKSFDDDDEQYLAMQPEDFIDGDGAYDIRRVQTPEEFAIWAAIANEMLAGGRLDIHPAQHYVWITHRLMACYVLYQNGAPASIAATISDHGISSLELVSTLPTFQRQGLARAVCRQAVREALSDGAHLITVRANGAASSRVYQAIGFKVCNVAI
ncbi:MAG: GNAT family N-acetyltransferase [Clostridia bacterium]|nr:GNAT family N-acetyltransferase [Clostridia bacterium]